MSDATTQCDLRSVFPKIPEAILGEMLGSLSIRDPIDALSRSPALPNVCDSIAAWMLRHPVRGLATTLPGLWLARDQEICTALLPVRVGGALKRLRMSVWSDVLDLTPSTLLDVAGFGEGCVRAFLAEAAKVSLEACSFATPPGRVPTVDSFESRRLPSWPHVMTLQVRQVVDWAVNEMNAQTMGDVVALSAQPHAPSDIRALARVLHETPLSLIFPCVNREETLEGLVHDLIGVLDPRSQTIFLKRISLTHTHTLEDIGTEFGISKERVRQLAAHAEARLRDALDTPRFAPVGWRAHTLRALLGTAVPGHTGHFEEAVARVTSGMGEKGREHIVTFLLWLAGPYSWDMGTGWLRAGVVPGPELVDAVSDQCGRVDMKRLQDLLTRRGLRPSVQPVWRDQFGKIKYVAGCWLVWSGTVADKAARLLGIWGHPATPEEIVAAIGDGHDVRGTRSRMLEDGRFMRIDMTRVALRAWGLEEYSTIAEEIDQELERRGGTADLDDLVAALVARFNLREGSIRFYVNAPMFVLDGGTIRRRTSADPYPPIPPVTEVGGCYLLGTEALTWRVEITTDTLRGSGRQMPAAIAAWLGITPGGRRSLTADGGTVGVTWPETSALGPSLGSIRFLVESVQAVAGDQVLLRFERAKGRVALTRIDPAAVSSAQGLDRISLLTGVLNAGGEGAFLHDLGVAIGTRGTRSAVCAELKKRGETSLAGLVPPEKVSADFDAAIDALRDLL